MNKIIFILTYTILTITGYSEEKYDPNKDAMLDIKSAISLAKESNKHVVVKVGGNWCGWCKLYAKFSEADAEIKKMMDDNYVKILVNYSEENMNPEAMAYLGFPERFGFPVFVILDENGKILHTQNSGYLEQGNGYDRKKVLQFLNGWTPKAIDPKTYQK